MNRFSTWCKASDPSFLGASSIFLFKMNRFFKITQDVNPSIHGRFIRNFSLNWIIFQNDANRPTLHLWALHQIILFKMNRFFKMTQYVHPYIHGRFIETFSLKWIIFQNDANRPTLHLWALLQFFLFKMNRFFKIAVMLKTIYFKEKVSIKRPWIVGWTSCVTLKNRFILNKKLKKRPQMKGRTVCVILKNDSF